MSGFTGLNKTSPFDTVCPAPSSYFNWKCINTGNDIVKPFHTVYKDTFCNSKTISGPWKQPGKFEFEEAHSPNQSKPQKYFQKFLTIWQNLWPPLSHLTLFFCMTFFNLIRLEFIWSVLENYSWNWPVGYCLCPVIVCFVCSRGLPRQVQWSPLLWRHVFLRGSMYDGLRYAQREHFLLRLIAWQQHPLTILSYVKGQLSEELLNMFTSLCLSASFFLYFLLRYTKPIQFI